jgi:MazG family protein
MDRLRDPGGCPWDREQSPADLRSYLLEEAYELAEAIDDGDPAAQREELGDLLFQIVFLARIAKERGEFDVDDVARGVTEKMIRRHPHVFAGGDAADSPAVLRQWEEIKRAEKGSPEGASALDGIPRGLPGLLRAQRLGTKAARIGFDWTSAAEVLEKVREETAELDAEMRGGPAARKARENEFGDLLFSLVSLGRHLGLDPEAALQKANAKSERRFRALEKRIDRERGSGGAPAALDAATLDRLWREVKALDEPAPSAAGSQEPGE